MPTTPLWLYNSLGRELQEFRPADPRLVRIYSCGPTVYNYAHLGNLRAYLFTDTLRRVLQWKGYNVLQVMNITDVGHLTSDADEGEDKMELAASRSGRTVWDIAAHYTEAFDADCARLNIMRPSVRCRATDHIQEMIEFTRVCEERGYTYPLDDGVYFDTTRVRDYGRLALLDLEGQREGARVEAKAGKRSPNDFAVWRFSPKDKQRLMEWHSPWGTGAPGWHLECSVMSIKYLGRRFDVHTGGVDHRQIHHCNEIAQNQAYLGDDAMGAAYWLHNEFLVIGEEKMAKSAGEFLRLQTVIDWGVHPLVYRYLALMATYRSQLVFSKEAVISARSGLLRLLKRVEAIREQTGTPAWLPILDEATCSSGAAFDFVLGYLREPLPDAARTRIDQFDEAVARDLNTPQALSVLSEVAMDGALPPDATLRLLAIFDLALGLRLLQTPAANLNVRPAASTLDEAAIAARIAERLRARQAKDFKRADAIRDQLLAEGVALKDTPQGTLWEWVPV